MGADIFIMSKIGCLRLHLRNRGKFWLIYLFRFFLQYQFNLSGFNKSLFADLLYCMAQNAQWIFAILLPVLRLAGFKTWRTMRMDCSG